MSQRKRAFQQEVVRDSEATQIHVLLNWFEELKQRVPTDNQ